jgi:hypothetical protein
LINLRFNNRAVHDDNVHIRTKFIIFICSWQPVLTISFFLIQV